MTIDLAAVIVAAGSFVTAAVPSTILLLKYLSDQKEKAKTDAADAAERQADRDEAQRRRDATDAKVEAVAVATDEVKVKVDGAHTALVAKVDALRSDKAALSDALLARDEPGALSVNDSPGRVTIDKGKDVVNIAGEDRRQ